MEKTTYMQTIKTLRQRRGFSQEELAEKAGLSLRTIQRIENGETEPRGDSLKRIAAALGVAPNDIIDWTVQEDQQFLIYLNLSSLAFLMMGLLGIILHFVLWSSKKDTIKGAMELGKDLINFQITWNIVMVGAVLVTFMIQFIFFHVASEPSLPLFVFVILGMFGWVVYNVVIITINHGLIKKGEPINYSPKINFLK